MEALTEKIDKIASDVSYMRGKYDEAIPQLQNTVKLHDTSIIELKQNSANITGKASIIGGIIGFIGSVILSFFSNKF